MKNIKTYLILFITGGIGYALIELLWRGHTHISMVLAGGICLVGLFFAERHFTDAPFLLKCLCGAIFITGVELIFGYLVNILMGLSVWDYSQRFLNFNGQICLLFSVIWFFMCMPVFALCRAVDRALDIDRNKEKSFYEA